MKSPFVCVPPIAAKPHTNERTINILALYQVLVNQQAPYFIPAQDHTLEQPPLF